VLTPSRDYDTIERCSLETGKGGSMRESRGKAVARALFYDGFLPSCLTPEQIRSGNFLLLMGEEPRELPYLDAKGVARNHIWSVERDPQVFAKQLRWLESQTESHQQISLFQGDMVEYLKYLLHENRKFLCLPLDVEGSYLNQLDPAMTSVMLFCWRNPETVVATFSSVGRDREMLWEGVKSLAILTATLPEQTRMLVASLCMRYEQAGFLDPQHMVWRDLFWLRSLMEHALLASVVVGVRPGALYRRFTAASERLWNSVKSICQIPLRFGDVESAVISATKKSKEWESIFQKTTSIGVSWKSLQHVVYNAQRPWSQLGHFFKFATNGQLMCCSEWLSQACDLLVSEPLVYIAEGGRLHNLSYRANTSGIDRLLVSKDKGLLTSFEPRVLDVQPFSPHLMGITQTVLSLRQTGEGIPQTLTTSPQEVSAVPMTRKKIEPNTNSHSLYLTSDKKLTEWGKNRIKHLAGQGKTSAEILAMLPKSVAEVLPETTIRAYMAHVTRKIYARQKKNGGASKKK
jgi:hypothetical protein